MPGRLADGPQPPEPAPHDVVTLDGVFSGAEAVAPDGAPPRPKAQAKKEHGAPMEDVRPQLGEAADREVELERRQDRIARPPSLDWGATVHLSNDDSMSLASAQRVLWAVDQGRRPAPSEVRPHELLNYFSFDTAGTPRDDMFSVLGAAEQHGDTLTVSLAVHGANPPRQPLDLTLVVDRSGSMRAEGRMEYVKRGLTLLSEQLQRGDRIDLVLFDNTVCTPLSNYVVGRDDPGLLANAIRGMRPTGSTNLHAGLTEAYRIQRSREPGEVHRRNRRVLLLTDAQLNTGNVDEDVVSEVATAYEDDGIRLTGMGVGRDFNDSMLDKLTEKGKGAYVYLGSEVVVDRIFGAGFDALTRTVAHDVRFSLDLPPSLAMQRFYGEEVSTNPEDVQPIHYYADTTQLFLQDLTLRDGVVVRTDPVKLRIEYRDAATGEPGVQELHTTVGALLDGDSHNLRKGLALMRFTDVVLADAMGGDACGADLRAFRDQAALVRGDAEVAYVSTLLGRRCGVDLSEVVGQGVPFKVTLDADVAIPRASLDCGGSPAVETLGPADSVARFTSVPAGSCTLVLEGPVPLHARVRVPRNGGAVRCTIRGGRVHCT